jgi:hypothetical protein
MTLPRFAALESRATGAVFAHLSNAVAEIGGVQVAGIFDRPTDQGSVGQLGMVTTRPTFTLPSASVPADWWPGAEAGPLDALDAPLITIGGVSYAVVLHEPDGTGMSRLMLEVQA